MSSPALLLGDVTVPVTTDPTGSGPNAPSNTTNTNNSSNTAINHVIVHPVVLFHILDHHNRRTEYDGRVIGTLLGRRGTYSNMIEITNCFSVPHAERGDEVAIGKDYNKKMYQLYKRIHRKETIIGWYATTTSSSSSSAMEESSSAASTSNNNSNGALVTDTSSLIHEFYASESDEDEPIHLVVDTRLLISKAISKQLLLQTPSVVIKAYKSSPVIVQGESMGNLFHEVRLSYTSNESDSICLHEMIKAENLILQKIQEQSNPNNTLLLSSSDDGNNSTTNSNIVNKMTNQQSALLYQSLEKLYNTISNTLEYVNHVVDGTMKEEEVNPEMGRIILDTISSVPRIRTDVLDQVFHDTLQDLLMVSYLSNVTRTQITIAEKLNATLGI
jgi:translation initiation factor 3 subunit F